MPVSLVCQECGEGFTRPPSQSASARWCSWDCRTARPVSLPKRSRPVAKSCIECGKEFLASYKKRHRKFCAHKCASAANGRKKRKAKVAIDCNTCGATVMAYPSVASRKKFCSRQCAALGRPINGKPSQIADEGIAEWIATESPTERYETEYRIGRWSIDLAFPDRKIAVELDGVYWHSLPEMVDRDNRKDAALRRKGWEVFRIPILRETTPSDIAEAIASTTP